MSWIRELVRRRGYIVVFMTKGQGRPGNIIKVARLVDDNYTEIIRMEQPFVTTERTTFEDSREQVRIMAEFMGVECRDVINNPALEYWKAVTD